MEEREGVRGEVSAVVTIPTRMTGSSIVIASHAALEREGR